MGARALRFLAALSAISVLTGCVLLPYYAEKLRNGLATRIAEEHEAALVDRTIGIRLRRVLRAAAVGEADCNDDRSHTPYIAICSLIVNGNLLRAGVRYDRSYEHLVSVLLGAEVRRIELERNLVERAGVQYGARAVVRCAGPAVEVLPVGAPGNCTIQTVDGRKHAAKFWISAKPWPHVEISTITGLVEKAGFAARELRLQRIIGTNLRRASGVAVARLIDVQIPSWHALQPRIRFEPAHCPAYLDIRDGGLTSIENGSSTCSVETNFGTLRVAVYSDDGKHAGFLSMSRIFDVAEYERRLKSLASRRLGQKVRVDCGALQQTYLSLFDARYCRLTLLDGRSVRFAVEYYDPFQGPYVVQEGALPMNSPSGR